MRSLIGTLLCMGLVVAGGTVKTHPIAGIVLMTVCIIIMAGMVEHAGRSFKTIDGYREDTLTFHKVLKSIEYDENQATELCDRPIYLGTSAGLKPATGWFRARLDGRSALVIEAEEKTNAQAE